MTPDALFKIYNLIAVTGWVVLLLSPPLPRFAQLYAGLLAPLLLSIAVRPAVRVAQEMGAGLGRGHVVLRPMLGQQIFKVGPAVTDTPLHGSSG
jgi:hypothetical protein